MHGIHSCVLCESGILGADYGIETQDGWVHIRCLREPELLRLRRWYKALKSCTVAVEAEGTWLRRARADTPHEAHALGQKWTQRRADLELLLWEQLAEFVRD